ncbi:MAG: type II secretion system ATPase GspE [Proteobacteria bacterium]|nr:type II secretion system ATPase GspE [Pseudomonadota bacterium]
MAGDRLTPDDLERARRLQQETGERLHVILTQLGLISERAMAEALADFLALPLVGLSDYPAEPAIDDAISAKFLKEHRIVPLGDSPEGVVVAMADPLDQYAIDAMRLFTGKPVEARVGVPADIEAAFDRLYGTGQGTIGEVVDEGPAAGADEDIERLRDLASEAPVIRMVNLLIGRAVETRASDIHVEPFENALRVRYRIDGVLREVEAPPSRLRAAVISRIKLMAKLNIAETRLPQDGRIRLVSRGKEIDLRVSSVPTMHGESVVLRILDRGSVALDFAQLGFDEESLERYLEMLDRPHGILLVTGPTGSGKTTTLYTSLLRLNTGERKILTVEDPIEYQLEGINQLQVKPQIGLSFANALRSFLRQDPDIIMIGEIRDLETAEIAVQAALTGHEVLSTLHTNDAASTVTRLLDMGVDDYLLTSTVNGVVAQRLVRTLCRKCRRSEAALPELVEQLGLREITDADPITLHQPQGCDACNQTGYLGRVAILETLVIDDGLRRLILRHAEAHELKRAAAEAGMRTMYRDGLAKALAGITSLEEVLRVTRDA